MESKIPQEWNKFYLKDVTFVNLMMRRVYNVLIVANPYDAFMLEDDGRVEEKIYNEYMELGLRYPPTFTQVSTIEEAEKVLQTTNVDLVLCSRHPLYCAHSFLSRHHSPYAKRGLVNVRLCVLLAWQHQPHTFYHQAHRG